MGAIAWLIRDGKPFLSLGVNHIQNVLQGSFAGDRQKACEEGYNNLSAWGFNTGGYGTPYKTMAQFASEANIEALRHFSEESK